jgi:hypothetical protein
MPDEDYSRNMKHVTCTKLHINVVTQNQIKVCSLKPVFCLYILTTYRYIFDEFQYTYKYCLYELITQDKNIILQADLATLLFLWFPCCGCLRRAIPKRQYSSSTRDSVIMRRQSTFKSGRVGNGFHSAKNEIHRNISSKGKPLILRQCSRDSAVSATLRQCSRDSTFSDAW